MISTRDLNRRFMKEPTPLRLGAVASDLARLSNLTRVSGTDVSAIQNILTEIKLFTEWTAQDADFEIQKKLLSLQRFLAVQDVGKHSREELTRLALEMKKWSNLILGISSLTKK